MGKFDKFWVNFISFGGKIVDIPKAQMYWLDRLSSTSNIEYEHEFPVGTYVEVAYGPFKGLRGKVVQKQSETRLVVWIDSIMQGVSVEIELAYLKEINKKKIVIDHLKPEARV